MLRNGIPRVCFYFCSMEWNSEFTSPPQNGSERNSESYLIFCYTERNSEHFSLPRNGLERNSKSLLYFCYTDGIQCTRQAVCTVITIYCKCITIVLFAMKESHSGAVCAVMSLLQCTSRAVCTERDKHQPSCLH